MNKQELKHALGVFSIISFIIVFWWIASLIVRYLLWGTI